MIGVNVWKRFFSCMDSWIVNMIPSRIHIAHLPTTLTYITVRCQVKVRWIFSKMFPLRTFCVNCKYQFMAWSLSWSSASMFASSELLSTSPFFLQAFPRDVKVNIKLSKIIPVHAEWLVNVYKDMQDRGSLISKKRFPITWNHWCSKHGLFNERKSVLWR